MLETGQRKFFAPFLFVVGAGFKPAPAPDRENIGGNDE
jgi:hypothetical protein